MIAAVLVAVLAALPIVMLPDLGRLGVKLARTAERLWLPEDVLLGWADNAHCAYEDAVESRRSHVYVLLSSLILVLLIGPYVGIKAQAKRRPTDVAVTAALAALALAPMTMLIVRGETPLADVARLKNSLKGSEELLEEEQAYLEGRSDVTSQGLITGLNDIDHMTQAEFVAWVAETFPDKDATVLNDAVLGMGSSEWASHRVEMQSIVARLNTDLGSLAEAESAGGELEAILQEDVDASHQWLSSSLWYHGYAVSFALFGFMVAAALGAPTAARHRSRLRAALIGLVGGLSAMPILFKVFDIPIADGFRLSSFVMWVLMSALCVTQIGLSHLTERLRGLQLSYAPEECTSAGLLAAREWPTPD